MDIRLPQHAEKIFSSNGKDIIQEIGIEIIKGVVYDVLCGENLRDSTELLTRKRIISLNAATLVMMIRGSKDESFIKELPNNASKRLINGRLNKKDRWLMQWLLGLTDKAFQNVLRDDSSSLEKYKNSFVDISEKAIQSFSKEYGEISGEISLNAKENAKLNWQFVVQLMNTIGAQTLAIRGSDKSTFGKLFEKLILGALLSLLGFELVNLDELKSANKVFWLTTKKEKRESDATLIYEPGKGARFDIGFIGRGNPEISLDKVSRFEREIEQGNQKWYMSTIIIVDRIGEKSRIVELAKNIKGTLVQMSGAYWPLKVAQILNKTFGYDDEILHIDSSEMGKYLKRRLLNVNFERILDMPAFSQSKKI